MYMVYTYIYILYIYIYNHIYIYIYMYNQHAVWQPECGMSQSSFNSLKKLLAWSTVEKPAGEFDFEKCLVLIHGRHNMAQQTFGTLNLMVNHNFTTYVTIVVGYFQTYPNQCVFVKKSCFFGSDLQSAIVTNSRQHRHGWRAGHSAFLKELVLARPSCFRRFRSVRWCPSSDFYSFSFSH